MGFKPAPFSTPPGPIYESVKSTGLSLYQVAQTQQALQTSLAGAISQPTVAYTIPAAMRTDVLLGTTGYSVSALLEKPQVRKGVGLAAISEMAYKSKKKEEGILWLNDMSFKIDKFLPPKKKVDKFDIGGAIKTDTGTGQILLQKQKTKQIQKLKTIDLTKFKLPQFQQQKAVIKATNQTIIQTKNH